jgi:predicted HAD superfamily hydrolase
MPVKLTSTETLKETILELNRKIIVFDIFDTIIHRHIHPQDIKKIASGKLKDMFPGIPYTANEIYELRCEFERQLCLENYDLKGLDQEFRFDDLATLFYERILSAKQRQAIHLAEFKKALTEIEVSVEISNQHTDTHVVATINELSKKGYTVFLCSDFYLSSEALKQMLAPYGITNSIKEVFVSSEYLLTKRSGKLYDKVKAHINFSDAVMIGDNLESDFIRSSEKGMEAIHIDRSTKHQFYQEKAVTFGKELEQLNDLKAAYSSVSGIFPEFSLSSFYFIRKLYYELKEQGFKHAFFLAREGQLMMKLFTIFQDTCIGIESEKIKPHYIKVSRRATFLPSLKSLEKETFFNLFRQYINISFAEFMQSLGFERADIEAIASEVGIDAEQREMDFPRSSTFLKIITSDSFINLYENRRIEQRNLFIRYVNQFTDDIPQKKLALIDVGWKGTIQDNISNLFSEERELHGYYVGMVIPYQNTPISLKKGLLFSASNVDNFYSTFNENRSLFEVLFAANHGSAKYYEVNSSGFVDAVLEDFSEEEGFFKHNISGIMTAIETRFKNICEVFNRQVWDENRFKRHVAICHGRMVYMPTTEELEWFLALYHVENFGVFERNFFNRQEKKIKLLDRFSNLLEYKKYPEKFTQDVLWPYAELQKYGLFKEAIKYGSKKLKNICTV